jgi:hypothetical protein
MNCFSLETNPEESQPITTYHQQSKIASYHSDSDTDSDTELDAQPESLNDQSVHNVPARNQQHATANRSSTAHDDRIDEHIK